MMWPGVNKVSWLVPWEGVGGGTPDDGTACELYKEVGKRHVLYGIKARIVAMRQDCDDTLFELLDGSERFAVVHLAYGHHPEPDPEYPTTEIYGSWLEFEEERMKSDAAEWGK